jgi:hypothetical protein
MVDLGRSSPREGLAVTLTACIASRRSAPCTAWHDNERPLSAQRGRSVRTPNEHRECAPRWASVSPTPVSATPVSATSEYPGEY